MTDKRESIGWVGLGGRLNWLKRRASACGVAITLTLRLGGGGPLACRRARTVHLCLFK